MIYNLLVENSSSFTSYLYVQHIIRRKDCILTRLVKFVAKTLMAHVVAHMDKVGASGTKSLTRLNRLLDTEMRGMWPVTKCADDENRRMHHRFHGRGIDTATIGGVHEITDTVG
jgi:hypothetical protein